MSQKQPLQQQAQPDPSWSKMDPAWVADFIREESSFDADKIEQMLQFAVDAAKNSQTVTVTLSAAAVEALSRYRQAKSTFEVVGHDAEECADLFLATERAAEELGKQIAALAPDTD